MRQMTSAPLQRLQPNAKPLPFVGINFSSNGFNINVHCPLKPGGQTAEVTASLYAALVSLLRSDLGFDRSLPDHDKQYVPQVYVPSLPDLPDPTSPASPNRNRDRLP